MSHIPRDVVLDFLMVNLYEKVGVWFEGYVNGLRGGFQWDHFSEAVYRRFRISNFTLMRNFQHSNKMWGC